jgi:hypothetical protein
VRELVYLSDRKLEQFLPTLRSFWPRPKVNLKSPVADVALEPVQDAEKNRIRHLARVIADIEISARWFTDPDVKAGQWIHFEAPLNHLEVDSDGMDIVFFVDPKTATANYPTGGSTRLILHCSGSHLRTRNPPTRVDRPNGEQVRLVQPSGSGPGVFTVDNIQLLLRLLRSQPQPVDNDKPPLPIPPRQLRLPTAVSRLLRAIDSRVFPETAAWMAGYARVTASVAAPGKRLHPAHYLIASPLYVEYAAPPSTT